jgi:hypothetical protein
VAGSAVNGLVTFSSLRIDTAGIDYTLTVTSDGLTSATSSSFAINPSSAIGIGFLGQPGGPGPPGKPLYNQPVVTIVDAYGNTVTTSSATITISHKLSSGSGGVNISGETTRTTIEGVATFEDITLDKPGVDYKLLATSSAFGVIESNPFYIGPISVPGLTWWGIFIAVALVGTAIVVMLRLNKARLLNYRDILSLVSLTISGGR